MKYSPSERRSIQQENLKWPLKLVQVSPDLWKPQDTTVRLKTGNADPSPMIDVWRSRSLVVQVYDIGNGLLRLSMHRTEWDNHLGRFKDGLSWDRLQTVKDDLGYGDRVGLEVYPPNDLMVNIANIRHMVLLPAGEIPSYVWTNSPD